LTAASPLDADRGDVLKDAPEYEGDGKKECGEHECFGPAAVRWERAIQVLQDVSCAIRGEKVKKRSGSGDK
jgi:hypothetical protein